MVQRHGRRIKSISKIQAAETRAQRMIGKKIKRVIKRSDKIRDDGTNSCKQEDGGSSADVRETVM